MELLVIRLLLSTTALIASASSYQSKPSYVIPNISNHTFFLDGWINEIGNGNKYFKKHCSCEIDRTSEYFIVDCSSLAGKPDCPGDTILVEYSPASGYQLPKKKLGNTKSVTTTTVENLPTPQSIDNVIATETPKSLTENESNLPLWIIIGCEFVIIIVQLVQKLCERQRSALGQHTFSSTPQGSYVDPTPRPAVQHPPLPSDEAGYEVPIVPHAVMRKVVVHEGNKSDKNDTPTTEHYTYDSILDETEDPNKIYYSTINI